MIGIINNMTLESIFLDGRIVSEDMKSSYTFLDIKSKVEDGLQALRTISVNQILDFFNGYSRALIQSPNAKEIDGIAFLSNWIRKSNLEKLIQNNLGNKEVLNQFIGMGNKRVKAQPKGIVCHWIAGNIPTLALFSLFQSILVRNANIVRLPVQSIETITILLKLFSEQTINGIKGEDILKSVAIVSFSSADQFLNNEMSIIADIRIVWGGSVAVKAIQGLEHREHCEDIVFGPKYSFSVIDSDALTSTELEKYIRRFTNDIVAFEQSACSSPHVIFIETENKKTIQTVIDGFAKELERMKSVLPKKTISQLISTQIINKRAEYALSKDKIVYCSKTNDWTILFDENIVLEEPIQSRTIWIKPVSDLMVIINLLTKKIQTIGCAIENVEKFYNFVENATYHGVARCVAPGQMNIYDSPWDGVYLLQRLVNWATAVRLQ